MRIKDQMLDGTAALTLSGKLASDGAHLSLDYQVRHLVDRGFRRPMLAVADVTQVDSTGLGTRILALTTVRCTGGEVHLQGMNTCLHDLLR